MPHSFFETKKQNHKAFQQRSQPNPLEDTLKAITYSCLTKQTPGKTKKNDQNQHPNTDSLIFQPGRNARALRLAGWSRGGRLLTQVLEGKYPGAAAKGVTEWGGGYSRLQATQQRKKERNKLKPPSYVPSPHLFFRPRKLGIAVLSSVWTLAFPWIWRSLRPTAWNWRLSAGELFVGFFLGPFREKRNQKKQK